MQIHQGLQPDATMWVYYTAKNINATKGSRTAINADLQVGAVLIQDPYQHDGAEGTGGWTPINATRPQTSWLQQEKYVVVSVPPSVNEIPDASAPTQRRGGLVLVARLRDCSRIEALVDGTTDVLVGDKLEVTNGSFNLTKWAGYDTQLATLTYPTSSSTDKDISNAVNTNSAAGFAFANANEFEFTIRAIANLQTIVSQLTARTSTGGVCAIALEARANNSAGLQLVSGIPV